MLARVREDRLLRWTAYASAPFAWLALALLDPFVLVFPLFVYAALERAMTYGILERHDPEDDPDFL